MYQTGAFLFLLLSLDVCNNYFILFCGHTIDISFLADITGDSSADLLDEHHNAKREKIMKVCIATLTSTTAYSQSRMHDTPKLEKERPDEYEQRTWRNKAHVDNGEIYIPPMGFKQALDTAAKRLGLQIPGKGKSTYTKHFLSGVLVMDKLMTGAMIDDVAGETINANSDGVRGSGKRVKRTFPTIQNWSGQIPFYILDDVIDQKIFERVLTEAGSFIGIGRFRPENGGFYGRFSVDGTMWQES